MNGATRPKAVFGKELLRVRLALQNKFKLWPQHPPTPPKKKATVATSWNESIERDNIPSTENTKADQ